MPDKNSSITMHSAAAPTQQIEVQLALPDGAIDPVTLDYRRAAFLQEQATLLVSDLHWGKGETFQKHGIPLPAALVLADDLQRLSDLINFHRPRRLLILGDLIHGREGLTPSVMETVLAWREQHSLPILLVQGNHDRAVQSAAHTWDIEVSVTDIREGNYLFSHHPRVAPEAFNWCGHIHPAIRLRSKTDRLRFPCFHLTPAQGTLPAFSFFTGGYNIQPGPADQIFAVGDPFITPVSGIW